MKKSIYCLAKNEEQANRIIHDLHDARVADNSISVLYTERKGKVAKHVSGEAFKKEGRMAGTCGIEGEKGEHQTTLGIEKGTKSAEGALSGAAAGGVIGGTIGLLAGLGTLAIPGIGTLVAAGPIYAALSGVAVGSISGGIAGSLTAANIPEYYVTQVSKGLEEGRILIAVDAESNEDAKKISCIFENDGATDVSISRVA